VEKTNCFCPAPFLSIQVNALGSIGVCPKSAGSFPFPQSSSLHDKWMSPGVEEIRRKFLANEKPSECFRCWEEEKAEMPSLRKYYLEYKKLPNQYIESKAYQGGPKTIVIQLSNFCNYSCRTCHAMDSSGFNDEGEFYAEEYYEVNNRYRKSNTLNQKTDSENKHYSESELKSYIEMSDNLESIEFYGGEPILNTTHHSFLIDLINENKAQKINLFYCTNGSIAPTPNLIEIWKKFKSVIISFSIDCHGPGHQYVRYPGTWDQLVENVKNFKGLSSLGVNIKLDSTITVSLLNIYNLCETVAAITALFDGRIPGLHLVLNPAYYSIKNIPSELKEIITVRLNVSPFREKFQGIIKFMNESETDLHEFEKFIIWTKRKDLYRKQDFTEVFPDYYELISYYFDKFSRLENLYKTISDGKY
jgi:MoaA/NifB/PqqE/SkfB family radical SAM enzyme